LLILPSASAFALVVVYPLVYSFYLSAHTVPLFGSDVSFVGLRAYERFLTALTFWKDFWITVQFTIGSVAVQLAVGVGLALLLNQLGAGRNLLRGLLLAPYIIPTVVVALLWRWMLNDLYGVLPYLLRAAGIPSPMWLASPFWAMTTVVLINGWMFFPFVLLVVMARLEAIPPSLYEAAGLDGAGTLGQFRYVTLPQIREILIVIGLLRGIWMFNKFDSVWLITTGGPIGATETLPILAYLEAFSRFDLGAGATAGTVIFAIIMALTLVYLRVWRTEE
jgi:multiple sugar transport system permease protein